jgi:hypothetical protein
MNERIDEFIGYAKFMAEETTKRQISLNTELRTFSKFFAELIVKECIDTAFHKGHPDLEFLLKHFGVEE